MGFVRWSTGNVGMLVMLVVNMQVLVFEWFMAMLVFVAFRQMQPDAKAHQCRRETKSQTEGLAKEQDRDGCADKWCGREIRSRAGRADVPQRQHEQRQTQSVSKKS